jgi:hypothetical protein
MPITGIYTKDFPDLGRDAGATDLIPIVEVGNIVTKKTPVSGLITNARVVGALGFTPYNATNPAGYITGITSGMVTTALGFTPYNATNPAGYITSASLEPLEFNTTEKTVWNNGKGDVVTNTSFGEFALSSNTTGDVNTAFGVSALYNNTLGFSNSAFGAYSLNNNTTGVGNTGLGYNTLYNNTSGSQNTAIGYLSLTENTTGINNSAFGSTALNGITTGNDNTAIGFEAGYFIQDGLTIVTSTSNSLFLGALTKPLDNNQTNQIVIGATAIGLGSNTATLGNTGITITRLRGEVRGGSFVKDGGTSSQFLKADGSVDSNSYLPLSGGTLTSSGSANTLNINHTSGSGIALNILKDGNGEALTIVKSSGSGNAASITGGITLLSELNLTTKLADAHIASAATWNAKIGGSGTTNYLAKFTASGVVGNSAVFESGGNVGIGTASPVGRLGIQVANSGTNISALDITNAVNASFNVSLRTGVTEITAGGDGNMAFSNNTERMRITSSGNVGIGTTSPSERLTVSGNVLASRGIFGTTSSGSYGVLVSDNDQSNVRFQLHNQNSGNRWSLVGGLNGANNTDFSIYDNTNNVTALRIVPVTGAATFSSSVTAVNNITCGTGAFDTGGFFIPYSSSSSSSRNWKITNDQISFGDFSIKQSSTQTGLPDTYRFYITSDGNVGINTTNPTSRLHVTGLPSYADNAAAITGGLTVGAFYHTAGTLKVVI